MKTEIVIFLPCSLHLLFKANELPLAIVIMWLCGYCMTVSGCVCFSTVQQKLLHKDSSVKERDVGMSCISKEVKSYKEAKLLTLLKVEASSFSAVTSEQGFLSKEPFPNFLVQLCAPVHAF